MTHNTSPTTEETQWVAADGDQRGARSRAGFSYQDECIALGIVKALRTGNLVAVDVELATDLVIHTSDGQAEFVSIKGRETTQRGGESGWQWGAINSKHLLRDVFRHWDKSGRKGTATVWTNAGLSGDAAKELGILPNKPECINEKLAEKVAEQIEADALTARDFLAAFNWPERPLPRPFEIRATLTQEIRQLLQKWGEQIESQDYVAEALLKLVERRSLQDPRDVSHATAAAAVAMSERDLRNARRLTAERICEVLLKSAREYQPASSFRPVHVVSDTQFHGRIDQLHILSKWWTEVTSAPISTMVVHGPVGVGKTALALQFAAQLGADSKIFVLDASTQNLADEVWLFLDRQDTSPNPGEQHKTDTLFVIDGVSNSKTLSKFSSRLWRFHVLITSAVAPGGLRTNSLPLFEWDEIDAVAFLKNSSREGFDFHRIVHRFGGNPLALSQVVAVCRIEGIKFTEYLHRYESNFGIALDLGKVDDPLHALGVTEKSRNTLAFSIQVALNALGHQDPDSLQALRILSCCGPGPVSRDRLVSPVHIVLNGEDLLKEEDLAASVDKNSNPVFDSATASAVLNHLAELSLVRLVGSMVIVHAAERMLVLNHMSNARPIVQAAIGSFFDEKGTPFFSLEAARQAGHALEFALERNIVGVGVFALALTYASWLNAQGASWQGERLAQEASAWLDRVHGSLDSHTELGFRIQLCEWLLDSGHENDAERCLRELVNAALGLNADEIAAWGIDRLAIMATAPSYAHLITLCYSLLPPIKELSSLPLEVASYFTMAHARLLWKEGQLDASAILFRQLLSRVEATDPAGEKWGTLRREIYGQLAGLARIGVADLSPTEWALRVLRQLEAEHGVDAHRIVSYSDALLSVADGFLNKDDTVSAQPLLDQAREQIEKHHADNLYLQGFLSVIQARFILHQANAMSPANRSEQLHEAQKRFHVGIQLCQNLPVDQVPFLAAGWYNLASCYASMGNIHEAISAAEQALRLDQERYGDNHPEVTADKNMLFILKSSFAD